MTVLSVWNIIMLLLPEIEPLSLTWLSSRLGIITTETSQFIARIHNWVP
jgi:hypothetical protein